MHTARFLIIGTATTLAIGLSAAPAAAAPDGDTIVTFTISAGTLDIVVPGTAAIAGGAAGLPTSGPLGPVTVTDGRAAADGTWEVEAEGTDFETGGGTPTETITDDLVEYWSGPATATTGAGPFVPGQATAAQSEPLDATVIAFNRTGGTGNGSATWNPTLIFNTPLANVAGAYVGTVTHSVA
ncbi:hypothetical protein [Actinoplanes sp. NBRC 103695]|uniref:hypothetical protein n=1 Tax=Actinoplanes sp. NBRC 103695 TaxID=3032202 RepID=UPI0024A5558A|nr:hypothetical protein [Actinoplanes sp. NBRC 103695]GLY95410.1 hypothetical protein Acsp02_26650 [Actinoplanes sp. NBRC 103695]